MSFLFFVYENQVDIVITLLFGLHLRTFSKKLQPCIGAAFVRANQACTFTCFNRIYWHALSAHFIQNTRPALLLFLIENVGMHSRKFYRKHTACTSSLFIQNIWLEFSPFFKEIVWHALAESLKEKKLRLFELFYKKICDLHLTDF